MYSVTCDTAPAPSEKSGHLLDTAHAPPAPPVLCEHLLDTACAPPDPPDLCGHLYSLRVSISPCRPFVTCMCTYAWAPSLYTTF